MVCITREAGMSSGLCPCGLSGFSRYTNHQSSVDSISVCGVGIFIGVFWGLEFTVVGVGIMFGCGMIRALDPDFSGNYAKEENGSL